MSHVDALMQRADNVVLKDIFNSKYGNCIIIKAIISVR
jgi:hypothetical protein